MHNDAGFTDQQQQWLQRVIAEAIRASQQASAQSDPAGPSGGLHVPVASGTEVVATSVRIKPADIGLFYPDMPTSWGSGSTVTKGDKTYYRNVWSFTNRLKVMATTRNKAQLAQAIEGCLKGEGELWCNNEKTNITRIGLIHDPSGVDEWCNLLEQRFKQPPSEALQTLHSLRYTVQDARHRKSPTAYVSEIVAAAQACNQGTNEYALVLHAWSHLDIELRETIDEPPANTTIPVLIEMLRRKQVNWFDKYKCRMY